MSEYRYQEDILSKQRNMQNRKGSVICTNNPLFYYLQNGNMRLTKALAPHTDGFVESAPPDIVVMDYYKVPEIGGKLFLCDGQKMCDENPELMSSFLSETGKFRFNVRNLFGKHKTLDISSPYYKSEKYRVDSSALLKIIPKYKVFVKAPSLVIFDNNRMLHGRGNWGDDLRLVTRTWYYSELDLGIKK